PVSASRRPRRRRASPPRRAPPLSRSYRLPSPSAPTGPPPRRGAAPAPPPRPPPRPPRPRAPRGAPPGTPPAAGPPARPPPPRRGGAPPRRGPARRRRGQVEGLALLRVLLGPHGDAHLVGRQLVGADGLVRPAGAVRQKELHGAEVALQRHAHQLAHHRVEH